MSLLTRDQILAADDRKTERVSVPEWGGDVIVSVMSGQQRDAYEMLLVEVDASGKSKSRMDNLRAKLVACSVVDEAGNNLFTERDVAELGKKSAAALQRVFVAASRINRVTEEGMEDAAKNS